MSPLVGISEKGNTTEMQSSQLSQRSEEFKIQQRQKFALIQEKRNQKKQEFLSKIFKNHCETPQETETTLEQGNDFDIVSNKTLILETKNSPDGTQYQITPSKAQQDDKA